MGEGVAEEEPEEVEEKEEEGRRGEGGGGGGVGGGGGGAVTRMKSLLRLPARAPVPTTSSTDLYRVDTENTSDGYRQSAGTPGTAWSPVQLIVSVSIYEVPSEDVLSACRDNATSPQLRRHQLSWKGTPCGPGRMDRGEKDGFGARTRWGGASRAPGPRRPRQPPPRRARRRVPPRSFAPARRARPPPSSSRVWKWRLTMTQHPPAESTN